MDGFIECLRQAYGDLDKPNHRRVSEVLQREPFTALLRRLQDLEDVEDWSDSNYDLCFTYRTKDVDLLLSAVGPYFLVIAKGGIIVDACERESARLVERSGFRRVTYLEATSEIEFYDIDSETTMTPLFRALFSLQDRTFLSAIASDGSGEVP